MGGDAWWLGRTGHASQTLVVLHLQAQGLEEGDEHPPTPYALLWSMVDFTLPLLHNTYV